MYYVTKDDTVGQSACEAGGKSKIKLLKIRRFSERRKDGSGVLWYLGGSALSNGSDGGDGDSQESSTQEMSKASGD